MIGRILILCALAVLVLALVVVQRLPRNGRVGASSAVVYSLAGCATCDAQGRVLELLPPVLHDRVRWVDLGSSRGEANRLGIRSVPTTMFLNATGEVVATRRGLVDAPEFEQMLGSVPDTRRRHQSQPDTFDIARYF